MKRISYIVIFFIATLFTLEAQQVFNLKQCIETGLERNYSIRIVRNEQQIAENNATPGNAGYLPSIDLSGDLGGSIYNYNERYAATDSIGKRTGVNNESVSLGLNLNWTVFDGFNIQAEYDRLKELQRLGELNTRMTIEDFVANIAAEYYNLIRQKIRLRNLMSTLVLSRERLRIAEEQYYIGFKSRLDYQQAKVDFNSDSSQVLNQREVVHTSRIRLNELMALDNVEQQIQIKDTVIRPNPFMDEVNLWRSTLSANSSLLIAQKNRTLSEIDYRKAKSRNYPYVRLNAGYGYTANWYDQATIERQLRPGLSYGLTIGINVFDGFNRRREQRNARIEIENKELRMQELELSLRADMSNLWMAYQNNLDLWALEKENLVTAQENYSIAIERYKLGDLAGIELREAQNSLLDAEERQSIAEYATKLCEVSLLQLSGQILVYLDPDPDNASY